MVVSASELIAAREATARLLDRLGLDAYLFEVEPGETRWTVRVECAVDGGWETVSLPFDRQAVLGEFDDKRQQALLRQWRDRLLACTPRRSP